MTDREYDVDHRLGADELNVHRAWDNDLDPVLTVAPGDVVEFECRDAADGAVTRETTADDLRDVLGGSGHPLTGPVAVEGAEPGDVLEIEILDLRHEGWGFTYCYPDAGLLPEAFPDPGLHVWELEGDVGRFVNGIEVPLHPFPGVIGVAPAADGEHSTVPPRSVGGNLDVKHLTAGSTLSLPVEVEGALFSVGDCHAAQGDGEVCVTGIEAPMTVAVRLDVRSDLDLDRPRFRTAGPFGPGGTDGPAVATAGVADDLMEATRDATADMIAHLVDERGLTRTEAYLLCSVAVDLKINEVVDAPNWVVSAYLPERIFPE